MADLTDVRMESLLRTSLRAEADGLPMTVRPDDVLRRRTERQAAGRRRLPIRVLAVAAAVVLPLAAVMAVGQPQPDSPSDQGAVIVRGLDGDPEASGDYYGLEVILVDGNGQEHGLVRYPASAFRTRGPWLPGVTAPSYPKVSQDGWLAFDVTSTMAGEALDVLVDLTDPQRQPIVLQGSGLMGWAPDGALWRYDEDQYERLEPGTDQRSSAPPPTATEFVSWHPGTWALAVAADGSGVVVETTPDATGFDAERSWGVMTLDGEAPVRRGLPPVAAGTGPRLLSYERGLLQVCDSDPNAGSYCPDLARGTVVSGSAPDRPFRSWGSAPQAHEYVLAVSWAADGGIWKLVDRRDRGRLLDLVHVARTGPSESPPRSRPIPTAASRSTGLPPMIRSSRSAGSTSPAGGRRW